MRRPALARYAAATSPLCPPPTTIASYVLRHDSSRSRESRDILTDCSVYDRVRLRDKLLRLTAIRGGEPSIDSRAHEGRQPRGRRATSAASRCSSRPRRAHRPAWLRRHPDHRRRRAGSAPVRPWSSTTSGPRTSCSPRRCATPSRPSTPSADEMLAGRPPPWCPASRRSSGLTCVPQTKDEIPGALGAVVRPVGPGVPASRGQEGPGRAGPAVARSIGAQWSATRWPRRRDRRTGRPGGVRGHLRPPLLDGLSIQVALEDPSSTAGGVPDRDDVRRARARASPGGLTSVASGAAPSVRGIDASSFGRASEPLDVGDEPVDLVVGVLHRDQPLLDLAPRAAGTLRRCAAPASGPDRSGRRCSGSRGSCGSAAGPNAMHPFAPAVTTRHGSSCSAITACDARRPCARAAVVEVLVRLGCEHLGEHRPRRRPSPAGCR